MLHARRTSIPDAACSIYRERALPAWDWEKVLAWARFMQLMLNRQARLHAQQHQQAAGTLIEEAALPTQAARPADSTRKQKPIRYSSNMISASFLMLLQAMRIRQGASMGICCKSCAGYHGSENKKLSVVCTQQICLVGTGVQGVHHPAKASRCPSWSPS